MCFMYPCVFIIVSQTGLESWNGKVKKPLWSCFLSLPLHIPGSHTFLTTALSPPGLSSCSPAYLAGSPKIIAKYSWQVSDKACWCSAGVLDGQICYDWGHIHEPYTISFLSAVFILLNKLRTETRKVCGFWSTWKVGFPWFQYSAGLWVEQSIGGASAQVHYISVIVGFPS